MPGWSGCDVCEVVDALRVVLGEAALPEPSKFKELQLSALEERLKVEKDTTLVQRALIVAEGLREVGMADMALQISAVMPRLIAVTDASSAALLGQALIIQGRSLDQLGKTMEANSAFALAEYIHTLAGRAQRLP